MDLLYTKEAEMMLDLFTSVSWLMRTIFSDWSGTVGPAEFRRKTFSILNKDFDFPDFNMPIKISQVGYNSRVGGL